MGCNYCTLFNVQQNIPYELCMEAMLEIMKKLVEGRKTGRYCLLYISWLTPKLDLKLPNQNGTF